MMTWRVRTPAEMIDTCAVRSGAFQGAVRAALVLRSRPAPRRGGVDALLAWSEEHDRRRRATADTLVATGELTNVLMEAQGQASTLAAALVALVNTVEAGSVEWQHVIANAVCIREELCALRNLLVAALPRGRAREMLAVFDESLADADHVGCEIVTITPRLDRLRSVPFLQRVPGNEPEIWWGRLVP